MNLKKPKFWDYKKPNVYSFILWPISILVKGINFPARWLDLGFFTVQTSDIARFSLILYIAYYIDKKREKLKDFYKGFIPPILLMAGILFTIVIQPDFMIFAASPYAMTLLTLFFISGRSTENSPPLSWPPSISKIFLSKLFIATFTASTLVAFESL